MSAKAAANNMDLIAGNVAEAGRLIEEVDEAYQQCEANPEYIGDLIMVVRRLTAAVSRMKDELAAMKGGAK
jgi:predicted house-cleaning noncanonical NTP pyrophosphatase (MazG superfamily)